MLDDYVPLAHGHTFVTVTSAPVNGALPVIMMSANSSITLYIT